MSTSSVVPPDGAGVSRTSMTVAAGRISTGAGSGPVAAGGGGGEVRKAAEGGPMEARRRGYRQDVAAPPERGHPLANLTRSMSQPDYEPASAPAVAPHPASLSRSRAHHRRHLPARRARHRAGQLGPEHHLDGGDLQRRAVVARRDPGVGARLGLRRRRGRARRPTPSRRRGRPGTAARRCGWPTVDGDRPSRSSSSTAPSSRPTPPSSAGR